MYKGIFPKTYLLVLLDRFIHHLFKRQRLKGLDGDVCFIRGLDQRGFRFFDLPNELEVSQPDGVVLACFLNKQTFKAVCSETLELMREVVCKFPSREFFRPLKSWRKEW